MVKILGYSVPAIIVIIGLVFIVLSVSSRKQPELGLFEGRLRPCPDSPNCVCSEHQDHSAFIEPLLFTTTAENAWDKIKIVIVESGGEVVTDRDGYLHARFVTPLMRYIDDVELRMEHGKQRIQIRSASRVGYSDMGANRDRVARIRSAF